MGWLTSHWRYRRSPVDGAGLEALLDPGFVAIDVETTGLDPRLDAIVEIAAIPFLEGRRRHGYVTRVKPGRPIPAASSRIHGITDAMVAGAPGLREALVHLEAVCGDHLLVGHGVAFDLAVLARACAGQGLRALRNPVFDTMRLAAALHPDWGAFTFDDVATRLGIGILGRHTAEGDAAGAAEVLLTLVPEARARGLRTLGELLWLQESVTRS